jgi:hypothetical protein
MDKATLEKQKELAYAYWLTFHSEPGKQVIEDLIETYLKRISFNGESTHQTAFQEGKRQAVIEIINMSKAYEDESLFEYIEPEDIF